MKVLVSDSLENEGLEILKKAKGLTLEVKTGLPEAELCKAVADVDALVIRSGTKVTAKVLEAAKNLKWIGRAGIGVDNVDVEAASRRGVIVSNTPFGNMITTAEHAISLLFSLAREVPQATASMKEGKWEKKRFKGVELFGKTFGVVGLGNIGKVVADRGLGLKMKVLAYDPFVSAEKAASLGIELASLEDIFKRADIITVHTPLTDQTRGIVGKDAFAKMKKGVLIVNAARGGIVDEAALLEALDSGKVAGAALDVFVEEPPTPGSTSEKLVKHPKVICTPHLGAATAEAQLNVAIQVAEQAVDYLLKGETRNAVNIPAVPIEQAEQLAPYLTLAEKMGSFHSQMHPEGFDQVEVELIGEVATLITKPVVLAALKGLLTPSMSSETPVNYVNAPVIAHEKGIAVRQSQSIEAVDYASLIRIRTTKGGGSANSTEGAIFGKSGGRIVAVGNYRVEVIPRGTLMALSNRDEPGVIGSIGTCLSKHKVNIASMSLGRESQGGKAIAILEVDEPASDAAVKDLLAAPNILSVRQIRL
ncbi:MAG: phosphoglycerate dehydrogenase [Bdellovibrionota bacterium]